MLNDLRNYLIPFLDNMTFISKGKDFRDFKKLFVMLYIMEQIEILRNKIFNNKSYYTVWIIIDYLLIPIQKKWYNSLTKI